jgi:hypothetical protein
VARNIKEGERGKASLWSHPKAFNQNVDKDKVPPFSCALNYDAKAWEFMQDHASPNAWFWNVGGDPKPEDPSTADRVDAQRAWGEVRPEDA